MNATFSARKRDGGQPAPIDGDIRQHRLRDPIVEALDHLARIVRQANVLHGPASRFGHLIEQVAVYLLSDAEGEEPRPTHVPFHVVDDLLVVAEFIFAKALAHIRIQIDFIHGQTRYLSITRLHTV